MQCDTGADDLVDGAALPHFVYTGLQPASEHGCNVTAQYGGGMPGETSRTVRAVTMPYPVTPDAPTSVIAVPSSPTSIRVDWVPVATAQSLGVSQFTVLRDGLVAATVDVSFREVPASASVVLTQLQVILPKPASIRHTCIVY